MPELSLDEIRERIGAGVAGRTLEDVGVTNRAQFRVRQFLRELAGDQAKLLNFVYFHTEPMEDAVPQSVLDFSSCRSDVYQQLKPVVMRPLPPEEIKKFRAKLFNRRRTRTTRRTIQWEGPYDEVYAQAMRYLDEDEDKEAAGKKGVLKL